MRDAIGHQRRQRSVTPAVVKDLQCRDDVVDRGGARNRLYPDFAKNALRFAVGDDPGDMSTAENPQALDDIRAALA